MRKLLLVILFSTIFISARSSHIVGGEFELRHLSGNIYQLRLILYFDSINGAPGARDPVANVRFFRKRDNTPVFLIPGDVNSGFTALPFDGIQQSVSYTNNSCRIGELVTNKLVYSATVILRNDVFNDPEGYYVSWERCCRNYNIDNIYSDPQPGFGNYAGQTFYLEFPPVVKDGQPFINNSPRLFPPLSDYACPRIPFYVDFSGVDDDGDSLVYSIVTPLNTQSPDALPPIVSPFTVPVPRPGPYETVFWRPGFSINNIMNGLTNLEITYDGILSVTPDAQGLFVFAVKCEEFRDGIKIGELRRDFQMLVLDACPVPVPPKIDGREFGGSAFGTDGALEITFDGSESDNERSFDVKISDPSSSLPDDNFSERITKLKAIALDFKKDINSIIPAGTSATLSNGSEAVFQIKLPACPFTKTGSYTIGIIAFDDACAVPLTDTLIVKVNHAPPPNSKPVFDNGGKGTEIVEAIEEGISMQSWPITVSDPENDPLSYRLQADFHLASFGMNFTGVPSGVVNGPINKALTWDPKCDIYDFTEKSSFDVYFIVEDLDPCSITNADTTHFQLSIADFSQITPPVIDNSVITDAKTIELNIKMYGDPLVFDVTGQDPDNTLILLRGKGVGFNAAAYGVKFPQDFKQGAVASQFTWELTCDTLDINIERPFEFEMVVVDSLNKCKFYKADTLQVIVHVEPPEREEFIPPNVFTPNGDDKNQFFAMVKYDEGTGEFVNILPDDNCFGRFVSIQIYDRWGKQVYESTSRDFRWYGEGVPVGVYFYSLKFTNRDYKGIVSVRY